MSSTLRRVLATVTATVTALALAVPVAGAQEARAEIQRTTDVNAGGVRFEATPGSTITVPGLGTFADTIEVYPAPDGKVIVTNELSLEQYVEGLGEMPTSWPMEALKAQAVAARTYAWYVERLDTYNKRGWDFDICGTVACQVFKGRAVVNDPNYGQRWAQAVADTHGQVLTDDNAPILARFFAASGGQTRRNIDVFPDSGDIPYLQSVEDPADAVSPLNRWNVTFSREAMNAILGRGQTLSAAVPFADMRVEPADYGHPDIRTDRVVITRADGHEVEISVSKFRGWVSEIAPQLFPGRYPEPRADGGPMPMTLPSSNYRFEVTPEKVVMHGGGFGHGVGMSQYGAKGLAEQGATHSAILSHYYGGIEPTMSTFAPPRVRVGLTWEADTVSVRLNGGGTVFTRDQQASVGPSVWSFGSHSPQGLRMDAPDGVTWGPRVDELRRVPRPADPPAPDSVDDVAAVEPQVAPEDVPAVRSVVERLLTMLPWIGS